MDIDAPGLFGKIPLVGDFVTRRLPRSFLDPWDEWLQAALASSREELDEDWLSCYLTSPIWRFALSPDLAGPSPYTGIMMPSVDKAGRYFPLTLAVSLPNDANVFQIAGKAHEWYASAESIALSILGDEPPSIDILDSQVTELGLPFSPQHDAGEEPGTETGDNKSGNWYISMRSVDALNDTLPVLLQHLAGIHYDKYSVWWTDGSEQIDPATLVCANLPSATGYAAMLGGKWQEHGWDELQYSEVSSDPALPEQVEECS